MCSRFKYKRQDIRDLEAKKLVPTYVQAKHLSDWSSNDFSENESFI